MAWTLVSDIGGTNARLGRCNGKTIRDLAVYPTNGDVPLAEVFAAYCAEHGTLDKCSVAVAGILRGDQVVMTNSAQVLTVADLRRATEADDILLLNDFEAAAWSLATVGERSVTRLNGPASLQPGHRVIMGPGTGLGVGLLMETNGRYAALPSEGGHVHIAPTSHAELAVFDALRRLWPEVAFGDSLALEAEAVLSGKGLPFLYQAVCAVQGTQPQAQDVADILANEPDPAIMETIRIFRTHLGRLAGDLALVFGANGGVFMNGGVAFRNPWLFDDTFINAFREGGRFTDVRSETGLYLCHPEQTGLIGARNAAQAA